MSRPEPRKSSLSGLSPFSAPAVQEAVNLAPSEPPTISQPSRQAPPTGKSGSKRMNYYVDEDQSGRIRTAYLVGRARYGWRSLTEFQLDTVMERVVALEAELNNGEPFEPSSAGSVSAGRPIE